jgi:hypothetical protein
MMIVQSILVFVLLLCSISRYHRWSIKRRILQVGTSYIFVKNGDQLSFKLTKEKKMWDKWRSCNWENIINKMSIST